MFAPLYLGIDTAQKPKQRKQEAKEAKDNNRKKEEEKEGFSCT